MSAQRNRKGVCPESNPPNPPQSIVTKYTELHSQGQAPDSVAHGTTQWVEEKKKERQEEKNTQEEKKKEGPTRKPMREQGG